MIMKNTFALLVFVLLAATSILGAQDQQCSFLDYDFKPNAGEVPEEYKDEGEIVLEKTIKIEVVAEGEEVEEYLLVHEIIYVNSDEGIENNNKIYTSYGENESILKLKNRVLLKDGTVIELNEDDIEEEIDEETGNKYSYFAVRGLEKGAVIEKVQVLQNDPSFADRKLWFQGSAPVASFDFQLISPKHLVWKFKSYNGLPEVVKHDSLMDDRNVFTVQAKNLPEKNTTEKVANHDVHVQTLRFKLFENLITGARNFYNYNEFAQSFYDRMNNTIDKGGQKAVNKFFRKQKISGNEEDLPYLIENHIKNNIVYNKSFNQNKSLKDVVKNKQANIFDMLLLYAVAFKNYKVDVEYVFTTNRYKWPFDKEFETTGNLDEILFYLPDFDQYIDITNSTIRTPLFQYSLGANDGLFISEVTYKGKSKAVAKVKRIELPDMSVSRDSMFINVDFSAGIEEPKFSSRIRFGGYSSNNFQPIQDFVDKETYKTIMRDIGKNYSADVEDFNVVPKNGGVENLGKKPFELHITANVSDLLQNAGDKYLFKLGQLIGRQKEIYQEKERQLPGDMRYPHSYYRVLTVTLPEGYTISNPEAGALDFKTVVDGNTIARFLSTPEQRGNVYQIEHVEFYKQSNFPLDHFESFRKVLNAAADFNKLVVVLEKN